MSTEKRNYVAVFPDGSEEPFELASYGRDSGFSKADIESTLNQIVSRLGLTTPRKTPQAIAIKCFRLTISGLTLGREMVGTFEITPPLAQMNEVEFNDAQTKLLSQAPEAFRGALSSKAWEDGHSAGYEEVIVNLQNLIEWLETPLRAYTLHIRSEKKKP